MEKKGKKEKIATQTRKVKCEEFDVPEADNPAAAENVHLLATMDASKLTRCKPASLYFGMLAHKCDVQHDCDPPNILFVAASMASVLAGLKAVDFYRKLKRDLQQELTEASIAGAALSICAAIFMIGLVIAEFSSYLSVTTESKVILDHFDSSSDDTLQV